MTLSLVFLTLIICILLNKKTFHIYSTISNYYPKFVIYQTFVPKQENAYDCGIFIMMYARKVIELGMKEILNDNLLLREVKEKINAHIFSLDDVDKKRLDLKRFCQRNYRSYSKNMDSSAMIRKGEYCVDTNMVS